MRLVTEQQLLRLAEARTAENTQYLNRLDASFQRYVDAQNMKRVAQLNAELRQIAAARNISVRQLTNGLRRKADLARALATNNNTGLMYARTRQTFANKPTAEQVYEQLKAQVVAAELEITRRLNAGIERNPLYTTMNFVYDGEHISDWLSLDAFALPGDVRAAISDAQYSNFIRDWAYEQVRRESGIQDIFQYNANFLPARRAYLHTRQTAVSDANEFLAHRERTYNAYLDYGNQVYAPFEKLWGQNAGGVNSDAGEIRIAKIDFKMLPSQERTFEFRVGLNAPGTLNCIIDATERQLTPAKRRQFLNKYGHLRHGEQPLLLDEKKVDEIGKSFKLCYKINTQLDYDISMRDRHHKPALKLGKAHETVINIIVHNNHATAKPSHTINSVEVIMPTMDLADIEQLPNFISTITAKHNYGKLCPSVPRKFMGIYGGIHGYREYVEVVDDENVLRVAIKKYLNPAVITGNPDDATNLTYMSCVSPDQVFFRSFIRHNKIRATPGYLNKLISAAARPFGLWSRIASDGFTQLHEIDHNSSYTAYETSPYYIGFPHSFYRHKPAAALSVNIDQVENLAFVEISSMDPINEEGQYLREVMPKSDWRCIAAPLFKVLQRYFSMTVVSYVVAHHEKYELQSLVDALRQRVIAAFMDRLNELRAIPEPELADKYELARMERQLEDGSAFADAGRYAKILRNTCVGRLALGGIDSDALDAIDYETSNRSEFEQILDTYNQYCLKEGITKPPAISELFDGKTYKLRAFLRARKNEKYLSTYAYCLAYSQCAMIDKLVELREQRPAAIRVDAIYFEQKPITKLGSSPGEWKYQQKTTKLLVSEARDWQLSTAAGVIDIPPVNPLPDLPKIAILGPPGTCKTHNALATAPKTLGFMSPTVELRRKSRCDLRQRGLAEDQIKHRGITSQCFSVNARLLRIWSKIRAGEHRVIQGKPSWTNAYCKITRVRALRTKQAPDGQQSEESYTKSIKRGKVYVDTSKLTPVEIKSQYSYYKKRMAEITAGMSEIFLDEFTKVPLSDMAFIVDYCERRSIFLTCMGDYCQTISAVENNAEIPETILPRLQGIGALSRGVCPQNMKDMGFVCYIDPRNERSPTNDKGHRHSYEYGNFLDTMRDKTYEEQREILIASGRYQTIARKDFYSAQYIEGDALLISGTWADVYRHTIRQVNAQKELPIIRCRDKKTREPSRQVVSPNVWTDKKRMEDKAPKTAKYVAFEGASVDSLQGETLCMTTYIDVQNLTRHGALYTAVTRSPTAETVILLI